MDFGIFSEYTLDVHKTLKVVCPDQNTLPQHVRLSWQLGNEVIQTPEYKWSSVGQDGVNLDFQSDTLNLCLKCKERYRPVV